jgi:hypothetical protein
MAQPNVDFNVSGEAVMPSCLVIARDLREN